MPISVDVFSLSNEHLHAYLANASTRQKYPFLEKWPFSEIQLQDLPGSPTFAKQFSE
jgi:hypothetical protein